MADKDRKDDDEKRREEEDAEDEELAPKGKEAVDESPPKKAAAEKPAEAADTVKPDEGEKGDKGDKGEKGEKANAAADEEAEDEGDEPADDGDDEKAADEEEEEDDKPRPRPGAARSKDAPGEKKRPAASTKKSVPARSARLSQRRQPPKGSLAKSLMLFVVIVGGLIVIFAVLGREQPGGAGPVPAPKWGVGQTVDVEITLVPSDAKDLACASMEQFDGKRCQFENPNKAVTPPITDDKLMLKPYTTTDRIQFVAAGVWAEPALAPGKLPNTRFSVKCKYKVEGKIKNPGIRWNTEGPWFPQNNDWYAGSVSNCTVAPP